MGKMFTATSVPTAVTAVQDLIYLKAAAAAANKIHSIHLHTSGIGEDAGDAQEEILSIVIQRGIGVTVGSGGAAITELPLEHGATASGAVLRAMDTTEISAGTIENLMYFGWNTRVPFDLIFTPETQPMVYAADVFNVALLEAPGDSVLIGWTLMFEEIGG